MVTKVKQPNNCNCNIYNNILLYVTKIYCKIFTQNYAKVIAKYIITMAKAKKKNNFKI